MTSCYNYADAIRDYIAAGRNEATAQQLRVLAGSSIEKIRLRVAENRKCPKDILKALANDVSPEVRAAVACHRACPSVVLQKLVNDPDPTVRFAIAEDLHVRTEVLKALSSDANPYVALRAQRTLRSKKEHRTQRFNRSFDRQQFIRLLKGQLPTNSQPVRYA